MIDWEDRTPECRRRFLHHLRGEKSPKRASLVPAVIASLLTAAQAAGLIWYLFFSQALHFVLSAP